MYDELILWIKENLILQNNNSYRFDKSIFKKMQYYNQDKEFIEKFNITYKYNNTYKTFIKLLRHLLYNYHLKLMYTVNYINSSYEIIYYIHIN